MKEEKPALYALKFLFIAILSAVLIFLVAFSFGKIIEKRSNDSSLPTSLPSPKISVVIDPGHGGEDAGAIAPDGTYEKDLNLEISNLIKALCILNGMNVKMTRETDTLLYDYYSDLENYTGQKKVYDLKNRVKIASESPDAIFVSIHMNKFPEERYSGTQIYYSKNDEQSKEIALELSKEIKEYLQSSNKRQIKAANSSIYVLNNAQNPAILIECGFLSNEGELEKLKTDSYQAALSLVIFSSLTKNKNA